MEFEVAGVRGQYGGEQIRDRIGLADDRTHADVVERAENRRVVEHGQHDELHIGKTSTDKTEQRDAVAVLTARHRVVGHQHVARRRFQQFDELGRIRRVP